MPQEKHRFRERVDFITSPGFGDGAGLARARRAAAAAARRGRHHARRLPLRSRAPARCTSPRITRDRAWRACGPPPASTWRWRPTSRARPPRAARSSPSCAPAIPRVLDALIRVRRRGPGGATVADVGHPGPRLPDRLPPSRGARRHRQGPHAGLRHDRRGGGPALRDVLLLLRGLHGAGRPPDRRRRPALGDRGRRPRDGAGLAGHGAREQPRSRSSSGASWSGWAPP